MLLKLSKLRFDKVKIVRTYIQRDQNYKIYDKLLIFYQIKIVFMINYIKDSSVIFFSGVN